jgi:hypothetical protein
MGRFLQKLNCHLILKINNYGTVFDFRNNIIEVKFNTMKKIYFISLIATLLFSVACSEKLSAGIFNRKTDSIQIFIDKNQLVLPGESFKIGVISYHQKNKIRKTIGMDGGSVLWWRYKTEVIGGENWGGKVTVNPQLMPSKGKYISIKVYPRRKPKLAKTVLVPLNYETEVMFQPSSEFDKAPDCSFKGEIISTFDNGIERTCDIKSDRDADNFMFFTNGLTWRNGKFTIEPDFTKIEDHQVDLEIIPRRNPEISKTFSVLLDYKHAYNLSFYGSSGSNGFDGFDGINGIFGNIGGNGAPGGPGEPGYDGPDIGVWTDMYFDSILNCNLLYVFTENFQTGQEFRYLVNPEGGEITVTSKGGDGGDGGNGGDGGDGGNGADGEIWYETRIEKRIVSKPFTETVTKKVKKTITNSEGKPEETEVEVIELITVYRQVEEEYKVEIMHQKPGQNGGHGGNGASGGDGGHGGFGGNIFLYFTADAQEFENSIVTQSFGGSGGFYGLGGVRGSGGHGGNGNPNGSSGFSGCSGSSGYGGSSGYSGNIFKSTTEEFFFYSPVAEK